MFTTALCIPASNFKCTDGTLRSRKSNQEMVGHLDYTQELKLSGVHPVCMCGACVWCVYRSQHKLHKCMVNNVMIVIAWLPTIIAPFHIHCNSCECHRHMHTIPSPCPLSTATHCCYDPMLHMGESTYIPTDHEQRMPKRKHGFLI